MKENLDRETVESVFSELEGQHTDMVDTYYSFQNGLILLKQCLYPSSRHPIAPDCEIPNSVIRGFWKEEKYEEEEEVYVPDYHIGFVSSKQLLLTRSSEDVGFEEDDTVSSKRKKKIIFQKRAMKSKRSSKFKRMSELSKNRNEESQNPLFIELCNRLYNEEWFPPNCEVEFSAIIDQLTVCLDKADSDFHSSQCDYILDFHGIKKIEPSKVGNIGEKLIHQLTNENDPTILKNCMLTMAGLNLKTDKVISLIKSFLKSNSADLRKTAKDALRTMGVRQISTRYTSLPKGQLKEISDTPSIITASSTPSEEPPRSLRTSIPKEMTKEIKKISSKESKSRTKMHSAKDLSSKVKKSKGKTDAYVEKPSPPVEPVLESIVQPVEEPVLETIIQAEDEPVLETIIQAEEEPVLETVIQAEEEPVLETIIQAEEEPVSETIIQAEEAPDLEVLETIDQVEEEPEIDQAEKEEEEEEEVEKEAMSISPEALQEAQDLPGYTQDESIEEKKEEIAEEDFIREKQIPELPTEDTEVLLDTSKSFSSFDEIIQQPEDDKEISKEETLPEIPSEKKEKDLVSELISDEKPLELPKDITEIIEVDRRNLRDKKQSVIFAQEGKHIHLPKRIQAKTHHHPADSQGKTLAGNTGAGKTAAANTVAAKTQAARNQATLQKQKQRHERDLQNRENITKLFDVKKDNYFLTKDANKIMTGRKPTKINIKKTTNVASVEKLRASLLPFSKGGGGYESFVKQLSSIDKLPKKTTLKVQRTKSMLEPVNKISHLDFQATMQAKIEFMESIPLPVQPTATTAIPPADSLLPAFAAAATLPFGAPVTAIPPVIAAAAVIPPVAVLPPEAAATAIPPASAALPPGAAATAIPPDAILLGAVATPLPGTAAAIIPPAASVPLPGAAVPAPDEASSTRYQNVYSGSDQQMVSQDKPYPGMKSEVPVENQTFSSIHDVLQGETRNQVSAKEEQKLSKTRFNNRRAQRRKDIADAEKKIDSIKEWTKKFPSEKEWRWPEDVVGEKKIKIDSSKEWARKFTEREYGLIEDVGTTLLIPRKEIANTEKKIDSSKEWTQRFQSEQEWRRSEDADRSKKKELRQKEVLDKKEFGLSKRWIEKPDYSSIHRAFPDPSVRNLPVMVGSKQEWRWSESDDWSKKRPSREKVIPEREEEIHLIKNRGHDLPWSNIQKTYSPIDRRLAEVKDGERERRWSESTGSRLYQKSPSNISPSNLEWSDKAFYPVDKLSPWMRYHLQYKPERIEEEIDAPTFELKNASQTAPEWFPKYRRMMFSPDFYFQREKWLSDYRRPTSIIY